MTKQSLLLSFFLMILTACAGTKVTDKLEKEYDNKTTDPAEKVGLKDDKIMIQKRVYLEERLHVLRSEVDDLQHACYGKSEGYPGGLWDALKRCRKRAADPRVGGTGKPAPTEKWQNIAKREAEYEFTVEKDKNVIAVTEESLKDRITRLTKAKRILTQKQSMFRDKLEECENKYQASLVQHGLDPEDTKAKGEWVVGPNGYKVWRMKRGATTNPEELMRRKQKRERKKE